MLPLAFPLLLHAAAPVVDLTAKPQTAASAGYTVAPMSLEQRVQLLERRLANDALIEVYQRLDALQVEMQQLRGMLEEQGHALEGVKQRQRDLYIDLDQRISELQQSVKKLSVTQPADGALPVLPGVAPIEPPTVTDGGQPPADPVGDVPAAGGLLPVPAVVVPGVVVDAGVTPPVATESPAEASLQEQGSYQQALDQLMAGNYEASIAAFTQFLAAYPNGEYRTNAQYWLGEAYYVSRQFDQAIESFNQVIADKAARKRPDALLKTGFSFYELKRWNECRDILERLKAEYPDNAVASLAEQRLQMLRAANLQ